MKFFVINTKLRSSERKGYKAYKELFIEARDKKTKIRLRGDRGCILKSPFTGEFCQGSLFNHKAFENQETSFFMEK